MTVLNEHRDMKKYDYLHFVEFLEFICRIAMTGIIEPTNTVEEKVYALLELIWTKMYEIKKFNAKDHPLMPID